jgi:hypothetical protein
MKSILGIPTMTLGIRIIMFGSKPRTLKHANAVGTASQVQRERPNFRQPTERKNVAVIQAGLTINRGKAQAMEPNEHTLGFDLRVPRAPDNPWFPEYLFRKDLNTIVSVDPFVFPIPPHEDDRRSNTESEPRVNFRGLLMDLPKAKPDEWTIALTTNEGFVRAQLEQFGQPLITSSLSTASALADDGWVRLGYDVADTGLISGLMNCGPNKPEVVLEFSQSINQYGLFDDIAIAKAFASIRDKEIPSHCPFYPVSIWRMTS